MKKIVIIGVGSVVALIFFFIAMVAAATGTSLAVEEMNKQAALFQNEGSVKSNVIYSEKYKSLLSKYLYSRGYVTLERLVYYLQRTNNVLDVSTLDNETWEAAYLINLDETEKQMIPIKWVCKEFKVDTELPEYTISSGFVTKTIDDNTEEFYLDKLDLCYIEKADDDGNLIEVVDVTESLDYQDSFVELPFGNPFAIMSNYPITSYVFAHRKVSIVSSEYTYHNGWDFSAEIGTKVYSVCDGTISSIVNTQANNLAYKDQPEPKNNIGNYVEVLCDNGLIAEYYHLYYNSVPFGLQMNSRVSKGQLLAQTSTTGLSTGGHLHLGLRTGDGKQLDIMRYIDLRKNYVDYFDVR